MAQDSEITDAKMDLDAHLHFAAQAIRENSSLRVMIRHFLSACHVSPPSSVFDVNPTQNAYNQGLQAAGLFFAEILTSVDPRMVPTLMLEELTSNEDV